MPNQQRRIRYSPTPSGNNSTVILGGASGGGRLGAPIRFSPQMLDVPQQYYSYNSDFLGFDEITSKEEMNKTMIFETSRAEFLGSITQEYIDKEVAKQIEIINVSDVRQLKWLENGMVLFIKTEDHITASKAYSLEMFKSALRVGYPMLTDIKNSNDETLSTLPSELEFNLMSNVIPVWGFSCEISNCIPQDNILGYMPYTGLPGISDQKVFMLDNLVKNAFRVEVRYDGQRMEGRFDISKDPISTYAIRLFNSFEVTYENLSSVMFREARSLTVNHKKPNTKSKKNQGVRKGHYVNHSIPFSCEIECYMPDKKSAAKVSNEIPTDFGLCNDGSLTSTIGYPIEIQTSVLKGKKGEVAIAEMLCDKLVAHGAKIDKTCGMHIHLDVKDMIKERDVHARLKRPDRLISLYMFYRLFEPVIVSFLPSTRRANRYCSSFVDGATHNDHTVRHESLSDAFRIMDGITNLDEFESFWYKTLTVYETQLRKSSRYEVSRYFGINFHSLLSANHMEVRYHSGTLNYEKILHWIDLHGNIVESCLTDRINESMLKDIADQNLSLEELTSKMFSVLNTNKDTVEYLLDRQDKFKDVKESEEILIAKTKKVDVA